jgi:hypothetical protein
VDLRLVLLHADDVERRERQRDFDRMNVLALIVLSVGVVCSVSFTVSNPFFGSRSFLLLLLPLIPSMVALAVGIEFKYHWNAESGLAALHDAQIPPGHPVPIPSGVPSPKLAERLEAIDRAQRGHVTVSGNRRPFEGMGDSVGGWNLALVLRAADNCAIPGLALGGSPPKTVPSFSVAELIASVQARLMVLDDLQRGSSLSRLHIEERVFANGASLLDNDVLLPGIGEPVRVMISPDELSAAEATDPNVARRYLVSRIVSWNGHVVTTNMLRVCTDGEILYLECVKTVERPLRAQYRRLVVGGTGDTRPTVRLVLARSVDTFFSGTLAAPFLLLARARKAREQRQAREWEHLYACTERDFDYGAVLSVRELASEAEPMTYFQEADVVRQFQLVDKTILLAVTDFLEEHGLDTSELHTYQTTLLNQGVIQTGGVSLVGNQAVGAGAEVAGSRGTVTSGVRGQE